MVWALLYFKEDGNMFTAEQMASLNNIPGHISKDSTFVNRAMGMLYQGSIGKLRNRSVKGTCESIRRYKDASRSYVAKAPLTPEKVSAIRYCYNQRIQKYAVESSDFNQRFSDGSFNKLLSMAIHNNKRKGVAVAEDANNALEFSQET